MFPSRVIGSLSGPAALKVTVVDDVFKRSARSLDLVTIVATRLYQKTGDLYLVQGLGHKQIATTEIYAKVSDDRLRRALV